MAKSKNSETSKKSVKTIRKAKSAVVEQRRAAKTRTEGEGAVTVNRRADSDRRSGTDRRKTDIPVAVERRKLQRREKVSRRRQIDPTTCERDYSMEEIEFMNALDQYKRSSGRMFPTCSEILEVLRNLGYQKRAAIPETPTQLSEQIYSTPPEGVSPHVDHPVLETASAASDLSA